MQLISELFLNFWYWWYVTNFKVTIVKIRDLLSIYSQWSGLSIQLRHLFKPFYQDKAITGLLVSIPVRLALILFAGLGAVLLILIIIFGLIIYIVLPLSPVVYVWLTILN